MKAMANFAVRVLGIAAVVMMSVVMFSCTNEKKDEVVSSVRKSTPTTTPTTDPERYYTSGWTMVCNSSESEFTHQGTSTLYIFQKGVEEAETSFKKSLKSNCTISAIADTVRVDEGTTATQTNVSTDRGFKGNYENDNVLITVSDGQTLELPYSAQHANAESWMGVSYNHAHDSLISARLLKVEDVDFATRGAHRASAKYVKSIKNRKYYVATTTQAFDANGNKMGSADEDTLVANAIVKILADNNSTNTKTGDGVKVLNETQQRDSVIVTKTWDDGHSENMTFNTVLNRSLKNIERREVIVPAFNDATYATSFSKVEGGETLVRQDANWTIYGREVVISKMVSVAGHTEEVRYTYYQERADFNYEGVSHSFGYVDWQIENYADDFKTAPISEKNGYDQLNYTNEIRTNYAGFIQMSNEAIAWFKESIKITGYGIINAQRVDYTTFTKVSLEKVAYYSDGTSNVVGKYEAQLPISVKALTNWTLTEDVFGVYTSGDLATTLASKSSETEKSFSYNQYVSNFSNDVKGQLNKGQVSYPNDIVFNDGDVEYKFANSDLSVKKNDEGTSFAGEDDEKSTYTYACVAGVTFGESSQEVTLPGTINITKPEPNKPDEPNMTHDHGKVVATYCTSTPNEDRSYWYNCAVIQFEDGYRMVGMANNVNVDFGWFMTSTKDVNSAVYADGQWIPAKAEDNAALGAMVWYDENGSRRRNLDYITATAQGWNNGYNTVIDVRREGKISADGYSVTFYLNGIAGTTLNF